MIMMMILVVADDEDGDYDDDDDNNEGDRNSIVVAAMQPYTCIFTMQINNFVQPLRHSSCPQNSYTSSHSVDALINFN